ncbi:hypothetical protein P2318_20265 [Myxococcaceae bacterium GXIMD 01537]
MAEARRWFLDGPLNYLDAYYPVDRALMGEDGAQHFALRALQRSFAVGLAPGKGGLRYLELMVLLGFGFDDDPQLPWARRSLHDADQGEELMAGLWKDAVGYMQKVAGLKGRAYRKALLRARALSSSVLVTPTWTEASDGASLLKAVYPEKFATIEDRQEDFFEVALRHCRAHDEKEKGVVPLYQVLMLLLGSDFARDPRYPWAARILGERQSMNRGAYQALHGAARSTLDAVLGQLREEG